MPKSQIFDGVALISQTWYGGSPAFKVYVEMAQLNDCGAQDWAEARGNESAAAMQATNSERGVGIFEVVTLSKEGGSFAHWIISASALPNAKLDNERIQVALYSNDPELGGLELARRRDAALGCPHTRQFVRWIVTLVDEKKTQL